MRRENRSERSSRSQEDYQAWRPERADADALATGFERVSEFELDERTGFRTSVLREPGGNLVYLRGMFLPAAQPRDRQVGFGQQSKG